MSKENPSDEYKSADPRSAISPSPLSAPDSVSRRHELPATLSRHRHIPTLSEWSLSGRWRRRRRSGADVWSKRAEEIAAGPMEAPRSLWED